MKPYAVKSVIINLLCTIIVILLAMGCSTTQQVSIIPLPNEFRMLKGTFILQNSASIYTPNENRLNKLALYAADQLRRVANIDTRILVPQDSSKGSLWLGIDTSVGKSEAYKLEITSDYIHITGSNAAGVFYGIQSLLQLVHASRILDTSKIILGCTVIQDAPRFPWRGVHLDVSRHFFPKEFIKKYIDMIAMHKLNVFHWHLVDDQGWRIEIKQYPQLTEIGAWREDFEKENGWTYFQHITNDPKLKLYGGFYSQDDIRQIVAYAQERYVTIVPEIEMPGHSNALLTVFPELTCSGKPFVRPQDAPYEESDPFCAGNDKAFEVLENILTEVIDLFPSEYIHIGGDEAKHDPWTTCPKCQARMRTEKLKDTKELQSYFIERIGRFLATKGRKIIGWDEILDGGLASDAAVMSWRGEDGGIAAAEQKHIAVMTPWKYMYFDHYQFSAEKEILSIEGDPVTLGMVYRYEPVPSLLPSEKAKYIFGVQANLWTEYIKTPVVAEIKLLPRLCALSEDAWTEPEKKDFKTFSHRLENHYPFLDIYNIKYFVIK